MTDSRSQRSSQKIERARRLRHEQTKTESLLWAVLRARQVCDLKFRRQHPIGPYIVDFACESKRLVVEVDGDYHDLVPPRYLKRQTFIESNGWKVLRVSAEDVEADPSTVAMLIASAVGSTFKFRRRKNSGSGMHHRHVDRNAGQLGTAGPPPEEAARPDSGARPSPR
ncbi:MAG: hypothetical protein Fues2KO_33440 [Fuerstiella sp.]